MAVGSRVNTNFPIPGIDQSSRGFRDNFATIKKELEDLQGKRIQLVGGFLSDPVEIGNGTADVIVPVEINLANVTAAGSNLSVQYNFNGVITGSEMYYDDGMVGINTSMPSSALHVIGNAQVFSPVGNTTLSVGSLVVENGPTETYVGIGTGVLMTFGEANRYVGIGTSPRARLDLFSVDTDLAIFRAQSNNSDNGVRFTTYQPNSTVGLVLEQRSANKLGGMRIDQNGNISIHANESMDANLSDASRVVNILPNNNVGIGSMSPRYQLDVQGNTGVIGNFFISGNVAISDAGTPSGIVFSDGSFQDTAFTGTSSPPAFTDLTDVPGTYASQANKVVVVNALENGLSFSPLPWSMTVACSDETSNITVGTSKVTFRMPYAINLTNVRASLSSASSSGNVQVDVNEDGVSIFSTRPTIDAGQRTSVTAATPAVISDTSLADDAEITVDIDSAGTGAKGLKVTLIGTIAT